MGKAIVTRRGGGNEGKYACKVYNRGISESGSYPEDHEVNVNFKKTFYTTVSISSSGIVQVSGAVTYDGNFVYSNRDLVIGKYMVRSADRVVFRITSVTYRDYSNQLTYSGPGQFVKAINIRFQVSDTVLHSTTETINGTTYEPIS